MNKTSRLKFVAVFLGVFMILSMTACKQKASETEPLVNEPTLQTGDGLVLEGEGPFPAVLLARSRNTLSNEENQFVLQEISQELDKIMDLASQLEVIDDAVITQ